LGRYNSFPILELIQDNAASSGFFVNKVPKHVRIFGINYFGFLVNDIKLTKKALIEKNIPIEAYFDQQVTRRHILFIRDPDNNLIEFIQPFN